jgi:hypothetical protein
LKVVVGVSMSLVALNKRIGRGLQVDIEEKKASMLKNEKNKN